VDSTALKRPYLEFVAGAWDQYTIKDCCQLQIVQRRAVNVELRFAKRVPSSNLTFIYPYCRTWVDLVKHSTLIVLSLNMIDWRCVSYLGLTQLSECRKESWLVMLYKVIHNLSAMPTNNLCCLTRLTGHSNPDSFIGISTKIMHTSFFSPEYIIWF